MHSVVNAQIVTGRCRQLLLTRRHLACERIPSFLQSKEFQLLRRSTWLSMNVLSLVLLVGLLAFIPMTSGSEDVQITFPSFNDDDFVSFGDVGYNPANRSYTMPKGSKGPSTGTCGMLEYANKVRLRDETTGRLASFSTSFSFRFNKHTARAGHRVSRHPSIENTASLSFAIIRSEAQPTLREVVSQSGISKGCKSIQAELQPGIYHAFSFGIDSANNVKHNDPGNNLIYIANNANYDFDVPPYTYNLCGHSRQCSYFSEGSIFSAWIDFCSLSQTLEVRLANGSNSDGTRPERPLLQIPNFKMSKELGDEVHLTFWGNSDINNGAKFELLSWSFFSSGLPQKNASSSRILLHFSKARTWADIAVGFLGSAVALVILWFMSRIGRPFRDGPRSPALEFTRGLRAFSYNELRKATENFDRKNLLGSGASGSVYRGTLDGAFVAVKQISSLESEKAHSAFRAEIVSLGQIRHRHVVQLQGGCQQKGLPLLLVYDYMPNGGLNEWLHRSGRHFEHQLLTLEMRQSILEGVGAALEYLHEDCESCVLHRDIKSSNVLLDADFNAHLADFGLARLMDHHKLEKTTLGAGTLGYMAPEMPYTGKSTKESDVYSFGILVLEVVCGRRPLDLSEVDPENLVLLYRAWRAHESNSLINMVDPRLLQSLLPFKQVLHQDRATIYSQFDNSMDSNKPKLALAVGDTNNKVHEAMVVNFLKLGLMCCLPNPKDRPTMYQVNGALQQIRDIDITSTTTVMSLLSLPTTKPLGLYHSLEFSQIASSSSLGSSSHSYSTCVHPL